MPLKHTYRFEFQRSSNHRMPESQIRSELCLLAKQFAGGEVRKDW